MLVYTSGDLLTSQNQVYVNPVNLMGVMGAGLALQFKKRFPEMFDDYAWLCKNKYFKMGEVRIHKIPDSKFPEYIINLPTKNHWKDSSKIEDVVAGLESLEEAIQKFGFYSVALPKVGCGLGGLDWQVVKPEVHRILGGNLAKITVFE